MNSMSIFWFVLFGILLVIEIATPSALVSIWFSLAALIVGVLTLFLDINTWIQILIFIILGIILLILLRKIMHSKMQGSFVPTNSDSLIGKKINVLEEFKDNKSRTIIDGVSWTIEKANDDVDLNKGDKAEIISIEGNKLIVK